jgi:hypothetical protein
VGDMVAGNDLSLTADSIVVYKHLPSQILTSSGILHDNPSVHFIAGNLVTHSHLLLETGPGKKLETTSFQFSSDAREAFVDSLLFNNMVLNFFSNTASNSLIFSSEPIQMANLLRADWDLLGETLNDNLTFEIGKQLGQISSKWARSWRSLLKNKRALEYSLLSFPLFSAKELGTRLVSSSETREALLYVSKVLNLMMSIEFSSHFASPNTAEEKTILQNKILQATRPEKISLEQWKELLQEISFLKHNAKASKNVIS